jgi:hypothetical protein
MQRMAAVTVMLGMAKRQITEYPDVIDSCSRARELQNY